jgi:acetoacetyl-CoA synthetase
MKQSASNWDELMSLQGLLFSPGPRTVSRSQLMAFREWCERMTGRRFPDYAAFDRFSVDEFREFWRLFLEWSGLPREGAVEPVCIGEDCETARFFPQLRLNYAECLLAGDPDQQVLTARHQDGRRECFTRGKLRTQVAQLAFALRELGVRPGDHVAAVARNNAEAAIAALATAAIGATFASCAPDMGVPAILARFKPLQPVVLFGSLCGDSWRRGVSIAERVADVASDLPSVTAVIALDDGPFARKASKAGLHRILDMLG